MPVDHTSAVLKSSTASNTANAQSWMTAWDSYVIPEAGTIRGVYAVASALTSNSRLNQVDVFRQPSGVSAASNSSVSILVAPLSLVGANTSVSGVVAASNQRVAAGDILQLKTNEQGTVGGVITGLVAVVLILPD